MASSVQVSKKQKHVNACGIIGMVGNEPVIDYLLSGLNILQNRGYDSAGIATIGANDVVIKEVAPNLGQSTFQSIKSSLKSGTPLDNASSTPSLTSLKPSMRHSSSNLELFITKHASKGSTSDSLDLLKKEVLSYTYTYMYIYIHIYMCICVYIGIAYTYDVRNTKKKKKMKAPANHAKHTCGIGHTRWATHGAKTDLNAHPHSDYKQRLALIHNGTIENCHEVKQRLLQQGIPFFTQTDTEVICNLVGTYLDANKTPEEALRCALRELEGSWGIAMICKDRPHEIYCARNGSPLVIGLDRGRNFVASEHTAFQQYTNEYIALKDGEIAVVTANGVSLDKSRLQKAEKEHIPLSPSPFPHWTIKEIMEQPEAVLRSLGYGSRLCNDHLVKLGGLEKSEDMLLSIKHLVMVGCGTSYHAALYAQRLMKYLNAFETVSVEDAAEVTVDTFPSRMLQINLTFYPFKKKKYIYIYSAGMLVISQSGETKDVLNTLNVAEMLSIPRFSVVNAVGSAIARSTGCGVYLYAGREHGVASTKAFLTQVTALGLIAGWFAQKRSQEQMKVFQDIGATSQKLSSSHGHRPPLHVVDEQRRKELVDALLRLPLYCGVTLQTRDQCAKLAQKLQHQQHMFVLGKGFAEPIAYEGALKIKEITYMHAEGYSGGALKHGPFAMIEEGTPVIMIILDDAHAKTMITNAHEIESRGGKMIYITNNADLLQGLHGDIIQIPSNGCLTALLATIPMQLLAYELSILKGINPDKPKNLAKAVTVD
ncbi:hypothetical protein RFI_15517 [Reticulomyxa filosa]|uniref:glutamine--fructose-6-phosphate transaminase (isomerizing) n=1 Tax=Reticulomyxa filosa TaxID=46433 RepID=X6N6K0_RETFI|nr:hypothetical protein RFI_15517 [Reticulomyxa filosa]|eukprot:ETO21686.1 hypothetical protein RFI_15517 [Reticulomyxa filosa]